MTCNKAMNRKQKKATLLGYQVYPVPDLRPSCSTILYESNLNPIKSGLF